MVAMNLSKKGAMELIGHEAIVQTRYLDSVGVWTIGVGHTKAAGAPDPQAFAGSLPLKDVFDLFVKDSQKYVDAVNAVLEAEVTQAEFDALVSFHFNTGSIAKASLTASINAGDKKKAAEQFMSWSKPESIIGRRKKEQKLFAEGVYSNGGKAALYPASPEGKIQWKKGTSVDLAKEIGA
jgi:lysozyme